MQPPPTGSKSQAGIVLAAIILAVSLTIAVRYAPYTFIRRDGSFYATISMGLVKNFSLDQRRVQPRSWYSGEHPGYADLEMYWSNISVGRHGVWYPKHSFLISIAAAPFFAAFGVVGFLIFNALCVVLMMWATYLLAVRLAISPVAAALAVLMTTLSPMLVEHTYHLSADIFNAALIALGMLALAASRPATAGALLGLALWSRPVTAGLVVPLAAALVWRRLDRRQLLRLGIATAVPLAAAALANTVMYGAPWITSYDRILTVRDRTPTVQSVRDLYTNGWTAGLRLMFASAEHGLVANALPSLVGAFGLLSLWRRSRALALAVAVGAVGFVGSYVFYRYFNARFFFPWELALCLPLAALFEDAAALGVRTVEVAPGLAGRAAGRLRQLPRAARLGLAVVAIGGVVVTWAVQRRTYVLADHVSDAKVLRNDFPCDYFNVTHQAWECSKMDRSDQELTGLGIGARACRPDGSEWRALTITPPAEGGKRSMRFEQLPAGTLDLEYGLRQPGGGSACFTVSYAGQPPQRLCADAAEKRKHERIAAGNPGDPRTLEITVDSSAPRGLCFDEASFAPGADAVADRARARLWLMAGGQARFRAHVRDTDQRVPDRQAEVPGRGGARREHRRRGAEGRADRAAGGRRRLRRRPGLLQAGAREGGRRHRQGQGVVEGEGPPRQPRGPLRQALSRRAGRPDGPGRLEPEVRRRRAPTGIMLVGLQGSGKTTTIGKLAHYLEKKHKRPLLVAADVYRPAAIEQLKVIGQRLDIPVYSEDGGSPPRSSARTRSASPPRRGRDVILFDTAGRLAIDEPLMKELEEINRRAQPGNILLIVDAMIGQDAVGTAKAFNDRLDLDGVILTKLDGDARGGAALSVKAVTGKPIKFVGMGESSERLEEFRPDGMASRILGTRRRRRPDPAVRGGRRRGEGRAGRRPHAEGEVRHERLPRADRRAEEDGLAVGDGREDPRRRRRHARGRQGRRPRAGAHRRR